MSKPSTCKGCPLYSKGAGFVKPHGDAEVMYVGEAPGATEVIRGEGFTGDAGAQLDRSIYRLSRTRDDFSFNNLCLCRPPDNWLDGAPWEQDAIEHCKVHFRDTIARVRPRVISIQGALVMKHLLGITGLMPSKNNNAPKRGYVYPCKIHIGGEDYHKCWAVPTIHPSFIIQGNQNLAGVHTADVRKAIQVAEKGVEIYRPDYLMDANLDALRGWVRQAKSHGGMLVADIETPESSGVDEEGSDQLKDVEIERISFSYKPGVAMSIPMSPMTRGAIQELFDHPWDWLVWWNADFDVPRLAAHGYKFKSKHLDAMWAWHFLQSDVPKGLGFVAPFYTKMREWKSLSSKKPSYYSCCDSDATMTIAVPVIDQLKRQGQFDIFVRHYIDLRPILDQATAKGILVDTEEKFRFAKKVQGIIDDTETEIREMIPKDLVPYQKVYSLPPLEFRCREGCGGKGYQSKQRSKDGMKFKETSACEACGGLGFVKDAVPELFHVSGKDGTIEHLGGLDWGFRPLFNIKSPDHVKLYMHHKGIKIPKQRKTGKETTDAKSLEKLANKDPLFLLVLRSREARDIRDKYLSGGYDPESDGRVHPRFTFKPSTGRLASERPNFQNVPTRTDLGKELRRQYIADKGNVLLALDFNAIEAVITGKLAGDEKFVRAAQLSIHGIFTSHMLKWAEPISVDWSDEDILRAVGEVKKKFKSDYAKAKQIVYLSLYGGKKKMIVDSNPGMFKSAAEADRLQKLFFETMAQKVLDWQTSSLREVVTKGYLETPFQYRHWFWDAAKVINTEQEKNKLKWGSQAKQALAFKPQSIAACIYKEAMLRLDDLGKSELRAPIHDELLFEVEEARLEERYQYHKENMSMPVKELGGLVFGVEGKWGHRWYPMTDVEDF